MVSVLRYVKSCPPQANGAGNDLNLSCGSHCGQPSQRRPKHARSFLNAVAIPKKDAVVSAIVSRLNFSVQLFASVREIENC